MATVTLVPLPPANYSNPTPRLSALVGDPVNQTKARFSIYQSDGTTLVGTVDGPYVSGNGISSVSYGTALPVGTYKLSAIAMDSAGGSSAPVPIMLTFVVTAIVTKNLGLVYNVASPLTIVQKNLTVMYDTVENKAKQLVIKYDTNIGLVKDLTLLWNIKTPWQRVPELATAWTRVVDP